MPKDGPSDAGLFATLAARIVKLREQRHSGLVVIEIVLHQGGVRGCEIQVRERVAVKS